MELNGKSFLLLNLVTGAVANNYQLAMAEKQSRKSNNKNVALFLFDDVDIVIPVNDAVWIAGCDCSDGVPAVNIRPAFNLLLTERRVCL